MLRLLLLTAAWHLKWALTSTPTSTCPATDQTNAISGSSMVQRLYKFGQATVTDEESVSNADANANSTRRMVNSDRQYKMGRTSVVDDKPLSYANHKDAAAVDTLQKSALASVSSTVVDDKPTSHADHKDGAAVDTRPKNVLASVSRMVGSYLQPQTGSVFYLTLITMVIVMLPLFALLFFICVKIDDDMPRGDTGGTSDSTKAGLSRQTPTKAKAPSDQSYERQSKHGKRSSEASAQKRSSSEIHNHEAEGYSEAAIQRLHERHAQKHGPVTKASTEAPIFSLTSEVADWWSGSSVLCNELVASSERLLALKTLNQVSSGETRCYDVIEAKGNECFLHVRLRPGSDEGAPVAGGPPQPDAEVLELLTEEQGELLAFCCMPSHKFSACADIFKRDGKIFGHVYAELEYKRFVLRYAEAKWMITGDFPAHKLRITSKDGQPIAWTEHSTRGFKQEKSSVKKIEVHVAPEVDAGVVICVLHVVDRTFGISTRI